MDARVIAIDWSGAVSGAAMKIWLAEAVDGRLVRLESGRDRDEIVEHLIAHAATHPRTVVGLDFAFSLPAWYVQERGWASPHELWAAADREADDWLATAKWPFWGKPGTKKPSLLAHFRQTELDAPVIAGISPKSVFHIHGAGTVGTGSLRGMRLLHRLHAVKFSIWPFDPPGWPRVVEIYPRLLTGRVVKKNPDACRTYLAAHYPDLDPGLAGLAASSEDAFDAAVSALVMAAHLPRLVDLPQATDETARLEGLIWRPPWEPDRPTRVP